MATTADREQARRSFYARCVDEAELIEASRVDGVDQEIDMLRTKVREYFEQRPEELPVALKLVDTLLKAVLVRYRISGRRAQDMADHLTAFVDHFAASLLEDG